MAQINFIDSDGAAALSNGVPYAGGRFKGWTPNRNPVGAKETALGTGRRFAFTFRRDRVATFTLDEIPMSSLDVLIRLKEHLEEGGLCEVETDDNADRTYPECGIAEGTSVEIRQQSGTDLTYSVTMTLVNIGSTDDLICDYTE